MPEVVYTGGMPAVEIPMRDGTAVTAQRDGDPVEVSEDVATELLARDDFRKPDTKTKAKPTGDVVENA